MHNHTAAVVAPQATIAAPHVNEKRHLRGVHCRPEKEAEYRFCDSCGKLIFTKVRYRWRHTSHCDGTGACRGRDKTFGYYYRAVRGGIVRQKPPYADSLLYHVDEIDAALFSHSPLPVFWCEGEKDADAIRAAGGLATSHHQ